jgi:hypothetical protein
MLSSIILCVRLEFIDFEYQHQEYFKQIKGSHALMMYLMDALAKIKKYIYTSWFVTFWYRRLHSCSLNSVVMIERSKTLSKWLHLISSWITFVKSETNLIPHYIFIMSNYCNVNEFSLQRQFTSCLGPLVYTCSQGLLSYLAFDSFDIVSTCYYRNVSCTQMTLLLLLLLLLY